MVQEEPLPGKPKKISRAALVGVWQQMTGVSGLEYSFELRANGSAVQRVRMNDREISAVAGTWEFDGKRTWKVNLPREEIEHDIVAINSNRMECTNWDDDALKIRFKRKRQQ